MQVLGAILIQGDADGETLLDLDEIARRIVNGDEGERAAGGIRETEDSAFVLDVWNGIAVLFTIWSFTISLFTSFIRSALPYGSFI